MVGSTRRNHHGPAGPIAFVLGILVLVGQMGGVASANPPPASAGGIGLVEESDGVVKTGGILTLDCNPEQSTSPTGTTHTVTCESIAPGANVDIEVSGANDPDQENTPETPDFTCTTSNDGSCLFDHGPGDEAGTTTYMAWIDLDGSDATTEADDAEGRDEGATPGNQAESDGTDVVEQTWVLGRRRTIVLRAGNHTVQYGKKVRLIGSIDGAPACEAGQEVRLRARPYNSRRKFATVATIATDTNGRYKFRLAVTHSRTYYTVAPRTPTCKRAVSRRSTVFVSRPR